MSIFPSSPILSPYIYIYIYIYDMSIFPSVSASHLSAFCLFSSRILQTILPYISFHPSVRTIVHQFVFASFFPSVLHLSFRSSVCPFLHRESCLIYSLLLLCCCCCCVACKLRLQRKTDAWKQRPIKANNNR